MRTYEALGISAPNGGGPVVIDNVGRIAGSAALEGEQSAAFLLDNGRLTVLEPKERDRGIMSIDGSTAAGWVSLGGEGRGQLDYRPALWNLSDLTSRPTLVLNIPGEWGQAEQILLDGSVLIATHGPGFFEATPAVHWPGGETVTLGNSAASIIPVGSANGRTLGSSPTSSGERIAVLHEESTGWQPLGTDAGWVPVAMNNSGFIVGHVRVEDGERPWIRDPEGSVTLLPYYRDHICRPMSVNRSGIVVGTAQTDHGHHPLVWEPLSRELG